MMKVREVNGDKNILPFLSQDRFTLDWWKQLIMPLIAVGWGGMALFCTMENNSKVGRIGFTAGAFGLLAVCLWQRWVSVKHLGKYLPSVLGVYAAILISCFFSLSPHYSFETFVEQHLWFGLIFLAVGCWGVTGQRQRAFLWGISIAGLFASVTGIGLYYFAPTLEKWELIEKASNFIYTSRDQTGEEYFRARGLMESYTRSALIFVFAIPASLVLLVRACRTHKPVQLTFHAVVIILGGWYLLLTGARGAWIATGIAILLCTFFLRINWRAMLVGTMVCAAIFLASNTPRERILTLFQNLSNPELLLSGRPTLWKLAKEPITDNLWTGVGYGGNIFLTDEVYALYPLHSAGNKQPDFHSLYLQILAEVGVFGFTAYLCFAFSLLFFAGRMIWLHRRDELPPGGIYALSVFIAMLIIGVVYNMNEELIAQLFAATLGLLPASVVYLAEKNKGDTVIHAD